MKKIKIKTKGVDYALPYPETLKEVRKLVQDEEDLMELLRFALHHRLRSAIGQKTRTPEEMQKFIDSYVYHRNETVKEFV